MKVLLVGSGGREHALAWKLAQSPQLSALWTAPGNPGTGQVGKNIPIPVTDIPRLQEFCRLHAVDLVVIGPEAALEAGLADACMADGMAVFGPSQAAARIETSKTFAKQFMQRHDIPTARFAVYDQLEAAQEHLKQVDYPIVVKASGLAAGKGVILPNNPEQAQAALRDMLVSRAFGAAGDQVVIEERLQGEEVSLLAFCDGQSLALMPPAQDHKRLLDNDQGPNTGGMGAYAPAPLCPPELQAEILKKIMQPAVDGLRNEGMPFIGVLYAGVILTAQGPQVLEFNARFGDPETQVIIPLLNSDLLEIITRCTRQELAGHTIHWQPDSAVCVVMTSAGYPVKSTPPAVIQGLESLPADCRLFHAGVSQKDGALLASGGRVLGVTGLAAGLPQAVEAAYRGVKQIHFDGAHYRKDIAHTALGGNGSAYKMAGVDIDAGNRAVDLIREAVRSTFNRQVLTDIGSFGGLFDATLLVKMKAPVLVASTDGVGTKVKLAARLRRYRGLGMDIVNHCIDDILVQGARPLFFLDYFAASQLQPEILAEIVDGMAEACRAAGCVLLGGETAEMPGVYQPEECDIAGTIVGCVERSHILPRHDISAGDRLIGLASIGPHTNGYSLLRKIFEDVDLFQKIPASDETVADALLAPHRSYLDLLLPLIERSDSPIKGLAHITGGGFLENIPRILPKHLGAHIRFGTWEIPPLFRMVQKLGQISQTEMFRVFNMGIGMVIVAAESDVSALQSAIPEPTFVIGEIVDDIQQKVRLI
ncbi:MAG: phosphoribosylamine--glycine ligase [Anaerolineales bacterium]|nr:phosphoribosylamine--glycine ligase [Anaerolineales bacterium]